MGVIQRQSIKNFFTSYIGVLIGFINLLVVQPRFLTPEELGLTRVLYSFALLLSTFVPMGTANIIIRYFPHFRNPEKKHHGFFGFIILATLIGFIVVSLFLLIGKNLIIGQYAEKSKLFTDFFYYVFPLIFFLTFITQLNLYCFSLYKTTVPVFLNDVVTRLVVIGLVSVYFLKWISLQFFITAFVGAYALQVVLIIIYIYYEEAPGYKIDLPKFKNVGWNNMFGYAAVVWFASVASTGLKELSTVILGTRITLDQVGIYVVAAFIPTLIEVPLNAIDKIATFNISTAIKNHDSKIVSDIYKRSAKYLLLIGGWLFLLINANCESLFQFLPEHYRNGYDVVLILSFGTLLNMATGLNSQILFYSEKFFYGAITMIVAVVVNILLLVWLIPLYGVTGAALATAISAIFMNMVNTFFVWKFFQTTPFDSSTVKSVIIILIVVFIDWLLPHFANHFIDIAFHASVITAMFITIIYWSRQLPELNNFISEKFNRK